MAKTSKEKIIDRMITEGPSKGLFAEAQAMAKRLKLDFPDLLEDPKIRPSVRSEWENHPSLIDWIEGKSDADDIEGEEESKWDFSNDWSTRKNSIELMESLFFTADHKDRIRLYQVIDPATNVVKEVPTNDDGHPTELRRVTHAIKDQMAMDQCCATPDKTRRIVNFFMDHTQLADPPVICKWGLDPAYALHKVVVLEDRDTYALLTEEQMDPDDVLEALAPWTAEFLSRTNDGMALSAWFYGVASGRYSGRQVPYIQGKGRDGKSTFLQAYGEAVFGSVLGHISWNVIKHSPERVTQYFEDKAFGFVPDCANPALLLNEVFKSLSGSDVVAVNRKFKQEYNVKLEAKVAIGSNHPPIMTGEEHNRSRTLWIQMDQRTSHNDMKEADLRALFKEELPFFLAYGRYCYDQVCTDDTIIRENDAVRAAAEARVYETNEDYEAMIRRFFTIDKDGEVGREDLYDAIREEFKSNQDYGDFKRYLKTLGYSEASVRVGGQRVYKWTGFKLKGSGASIRSKIISKTGVA